MKRHAAPGWVRVAAWSVTLAFAVLAVVMFALGEDNRGQGAVFGLVLLGVMAASVEWSE